MNVVEMLKDKGKMDTGGVAQKTLALGSVMISLSDVTSAAVGIADQV